MRAESVETVVIGGGQAGLAVGYHLQRRRRPFAILDAYERVGDAWRKRWDSLRLFTPGRYDGLPGMPFPGPPSVYPTKDEVADYLEAYARGFELPVRTGVRVQRLTRVDDAFDVSWPGGSLEAENVVVATGPYDRPRVPPYAGALDDAIVQLHAKEYRNPTQLREGGVLVVGAGNSGAEISLEAARHRHRTWLSGRDTGQEPTRAGTAADRLFTPVMWFLATRVLTVRTPLGRRVRDHFLEPPRGIPLGRIRRGDFAAAGVERVPRVRGVRGGAPQLEDGTVLDVANVVWCTGFSADHAWIDLPLARRHGLPVNDRGVVADCPGLYFVGLPFQYSLSSVLLGGVGRDAEHLVDHLVDHRVAARSEPGAGTATDPGSGPGGDLAAVDG